MRISSPRISAEPIDRIFSALGHPIRRRIVVHLATAGESTISDLAAPFAVSLMTISKHVRVLRAAGVLDVEKAGRIRWCRVNFATLRYAWDWLDHNREVAERLFETSALTQGLEQAFGQELSSATDLPDLPPHGYVSGP
ncbi:MAG: ArsR/SmtB family transcription factor [Longimicrobiales bacterium]